MRVGTSRRGVTSKRCAGVRAFSVALCLAFVGGACQSAGPAGSTPSTTSQPAAGTASSVATAARPRSGCKIAATWSNYAEAEFGSFTQGVMDAFNDPIIDYTELDARSSVDYQIADIDKAVDGGIDALIVMPQDPDIVKPAVERALAHGVPVVAVDRPIMNPNVLFVGQDQVRLGELAARALLAFKPSGRFVVIKGDAAQPESVLRRQGMTHGGLPDVGKSSGKLVNAGEVFTPNWDPTTAQTEMEEFLQRNGNRVDMVFVENNGMAGGVVEALKQHGLAGKVLVGASGGDYGDEMSLNNVALGLQTVLVTTERIKLGRAAGEAALALCANPRVEDVTTSLGKPAPLTALGSITIPAILAEPIVFDRTNLQDAIDRHFGTKDYVCKDVPPGSVGGC